MSQPSNKKPESYASVRKKWYAKLKKTGFKDIEKNDYTLKEYSSIFAKDKAVRSWDAKTAYYYMATQFLNTYKFSSELDRIIWEYHTNAISIRNITKILNKTKVLRTNRDAIWQILRQLVIEMKKLYLVGYKPPNE
jgi:hypothetical protein